MNLRIGVLKQCSKSESIHPLIHTLPSVSSKVISPHIGMFRFKGELLVDFLFGFAYGNAV